jgi:hypothetical protein
MKADRSIFTVLLLVTPAVFQLPVQQNEADRKVLAEIRSGADKGALDPSFTWLRVAVTSLHHAKLDT